jgi:hypothetical protein
MFIVPVALLILEIYFILLRIFCIAPLLVFVGSQEVKPIMEKKLKKKT